MLFFSPVPNAGYINVAPDDTLLNVILWYVNMENKQRVRTERGKSPLLFTFNK